MLRISTLLLILALAVPLQSEAQTIQTYQQQMAALKADKQAAEDKVKAIVNQPVQSYPFNSWLDVRVSSPGWFHAGAKVPDFNTTDIRATQEFPYDKDEYITSDVTPGRMFKSHDLEFNAMTKMFYTDRNLPKKRLTEAEMLEVNRLYRIIGTDDAKIKELDSIITSTLAAIKEFFTSLWGTVFELIMILAIGFFGYRRFFAPRSR